MIYLSEFYFPSQNSEANYLAESPRAKMTCYDSFYPFGLFAGRGLKALDLADVTILYGGNGSGKTTALNVMADALRLQRGAHITAVISSRIMSPCASSTPCTLSRRAA